MKDKEFALSEKFVERQSEKEIKIHEASEMKSLLKYRGMVD